MIENMNHKAWKNKLTPEQYAVLRDGATEAPFSGVYVNYHDDGVYTCARCGANLFSSDAKFDSGSGWPSFTDVIENGNVEIRSDDSNGMHSTEVICANCGGHLGHLFDDGPSETGGKRFCINSRALNFEQNKKLQPPKYKRGN